MSTDARGLVKLDALGEWRRTHTCGELRREDAGRTVRVAGWVQRRRDHGGVFFLDLRDRHGIVQVVFRPREDEEDLAARARDLGSEYVVGVEGVVELRPPEVVHPGLATGEIEIHASAVQVFNEAATPPFLPDEASGVSEDLRLEYRFLDLRRPELAGVLGLRHRVSLAARTFLNGEGFWEIETPMLVRPTPEGARDYLVPSRVHPGCFYALPQSPQLYKQLLMVSGMDRYYQLARCLRDEDLRADRQPEHTQIDLEMSFVGEEDVQGLVERLVAAIWSSALGVELALPFPRVTYREAMERFGSDKPDLRFDLPLVDLTPAVRDSGFQIFEAALGRGGCVHALRVPAGGSTSRKELDEWEALVRLHGAGGLARAKVRGGALDSGVAKFLSGDAQRRIVTAAEGEEGDLIAMVADRPAVAWRSLGALRSRLGSRWLAAHPERAAEWRFLWVREFPLFEEDAARGALVPAHHMFTMPLDEDVASLETRPLAVRGQLYDLVLNGYELGSGSIRIHRRDIQEAVMRVVGVSAEEAERRFGFLLKSFQYGAPPHGGIALGLDRIVMLLAGRTSLRDTIAFPKTTSAASLLDGAPSEIDDGELRELHIRRVLRKPSSHAVEQ